jgi:serine/threonine-protein kinase
MQWARTRRALLALRVAIQDAVDPARACDAESRALLDHEAHEGNARVLEALAYLLTPLCVIANVVVFLRPETEPARVAWRTSMIGITATTGTLAILAAVVARRRTPAALWRALGDGWGVVSFLGAAAMSANAQRAVPNINVFVMSAFAVAFFLRMTPRLFALALALGVGLIIGAIERFRPDAGARRVDEVSLVGVALLCWPAFLLSTTMRVRIFLARRQVELLNGELERRVEAQVGEIVRRAREVSELNIQLNEKIRGRSRELSMALGRLAGTNEALARGTVLGGRVSIASWIGSGGMGVVYRGRDLATDKTVAVKVIQAGSASELDGLYRFLREARAMAMVTHPAIVRSVHIDVSEDGRLFQMMDLVEGESLESRLARAGALPPGVAARIGAVLADALACAHAAGIVHRDVKPSNVMLTSAPPGLKLLDFGISKVFEADDASATPEGLVGTPEFAAPEQVSSPATVGAPADVYALGLVVYACVAGRAPFGASSSREWFISHLVDDPVELTTLVPDLDATLGRCVMDCLQKDPELRPTAPLVAATLASVADAAQTPPLETLDLAVPSAPPPGASASRTTVSKGAPMTAELRASAEAPTARR